MSIRDAYRAKIDAQVAEVTARLALARAKAQQLAADGKIAAYEEIAETEAKLGALKTRLAELGSTGEAAFNDVKGGVEKAWGELSEAAKRAFQRFE
jgi:hypothetical protein